MDQDPFSEVPNVEEGILVGGRGSPEPTLEGSSGSCDPLTGPIYKQVVSGGKEGWVISACGKPEMTKLLCPKNALQDEE